MRTEWTRNGIKWEYIPYETYTLTNNLWDCQWTCPKDYKKVWNTCEPPKPWVCASNLHGKFIDSWINLALYKVSDLCESEWWLWTKPSFMEYAFTFRADWTFKWFDESLIEAKWVWNWSCNWETAYTTTFCSAYVAWEKKPWQCDLSTKWTAACKTMHNPVLTWYVQYGDWNSWTNGDSNKWLKWQCPWEYWGEFVKCWFCDAWYTFHTWSQKCYANYRTVNCGNWTKPTSWTAGYIYGTWKYTQKLNANEETYVYEPTKVWTYTWNTVISNAWWINNTCMYTCADWYEVNTNYKCNPITYSITYHLYWWSNSTSNPSTYTIETSTFSLKDPSKIWYTFLWWTWSNWQTASKYVYIFKWSMWNKEYHAKREPTTYTISYNLYWWSNNPSNPSNYTIETNTITLQNPTKNGYTFAWWTGSNWTTAQTNVQISKGSTGNKTYNAKRTADGYTITYNLNWGTNNSLNPSSYTIESSTITLRNPTRAWYTFLWWTWSNWTTAQTGVSIPKWSTGNKTYTANWKINTYTISYTLNSGTNNSSNPSSYTVETSTINLLAPGRVWYTFKWWSGSNWSTAQTNVSIPKGSTWNKNYTANWNSNTYTISYSLNGGTKWISAPTSAIYDVTLTINNPTKEWYTFSWRNISWMDWTTHTIWNTTTTSTSLMNRLETSYKNLRSTSWTVTFSAQWTEAKEYTGHWACVQVYD